MHLSCTNDERTTRDAATSKVQDHLPQVVVVIDRTALTSFIVLSAINFSDETINVMSDA